MPTITDAVRPWKEWGNILRPQPYRPGLLGDGNGNVNVTNKSGWSWIRYDFNSNRLSMVRNPSNMQLADGSPVLVGKRDPGDEYEQVLYVAWNFYAWNPSQATMDQYAANPHGDTHAGKANDPAPIDLNNLSPGKVVPTDPASLNVTIQEFLYVAGCEVYRFGETTYDLSGSVPGMYGHRYVLICIDLLAEGEIAVVNGDVTDTDSTPELPDVPEGSIPLAIVELDALQTTITDASIWQYKLLYGSVCGDGIPVHTHSGPTEGGSSLLGVEELMVACWVDITIDGNAISPTDVYHRLLVSEGMYIVGDDVSVELITIHPDPVHGCGQLLFLRVVDSPMYASYNVILRHGIGNIQLNAGEDVTMSAGDHVLLICDGTYWHDVGLGGPAGGAPAGCAPSPHPLNSVHHSGNLADGQATQFLKTDGTRNLIGNLAADPGVTIDGIDISAHTIDVNAHHAEIHVINSTGPHAEAGLTIGHVLRVSGAAAFSFAQLQHGDLGGVGGDDHHARQHGITVAADHTVVGAALDVVGLSGVNTLGILTPDSDVFNEAVEKLLKADADGGVRLDHLEVGNIAGATEGQLLVASMIGVGVAPGQAVTAVGSIAAGDSPNLAAPLGLAYNLMLNKAGQVNVIMNSASAEPDWCPVFLPMRSRGTLAAPTVISSGDRLFLFGALGYGATGWDDQATGLLVEADAAPIVTNNHIPTRIRFVGNNTVGASMEWMRLTSRGRLGIGTTTPSATLDVQGNIYITPTGGTQDYLITGRAATLNFQGQASGQPANAEFYAKDGDGTDGVGFNIWGKGTPTSVSNGEVLEIAYRAATTEYLLYSQKLGTGTARQIRLAAGSDGPQLVLPISGNVGIGTATPTLSAGTGLHMAGSTMRLATARTPASSGATGNQGEICWDATYLYCCVATNTWHRVAHAAW